jgi:hypothetical protein
MRDGLTSGIPLPKYPCPETYATAVTLTLHAMVSDSMSHAASTSIETELTTQKRIHRDAFVQSKTLRIDRLDLLMTSGPLLYVFGRSVTSVGDHKNQSFIDTCEYCRIYFTMQ